MHPYKESDSPAVLIHISTNFFRKDGNRRRVWNKNNNKAEQSYVKLNIELLCPHHEMKYMCTYDWKQYHNFHLLTSFSYPCIFYTHYIYFFQLRAYYNYLLCINKRNILFLNLVIETEIRNRNNLLIFEGENVHVTAAPSRKEISH